MPSETISMMQRIQELGLLSYALFIVLGFSAGTVKYLNALKGKKFRWLHWFIDSFTSVFVGVVTGFVCEYFKLDTKITLAIVSLSAHQGTRSLYQLTEFLKKNSPIKIDDTQARMAEKLASKRTK